MNQNNLRKAFRSMDRKAHLNRFQNEIVARLRRSGSIPPTTGVNRPLPSPLSGQDVMSVIKGEQDRGLVRNGPRSLDRRQTDPDATYDAQLMRFIGGHEGFEPRAYNDNPKNPERGFVTVGYGFNMDQKGARDQFAQALPGVSFDEVYSGRIELSEAQAMALYRSGLAYYEDVVSRAAGGAPLADHQRIALTSIAYNSPKRVANMAPALRSGDTQRVVDMILYESFDPHHDLRNGLANRRWKEAIQFVGHIDAPRYLPSFDAYKAYWRKPGGAGRRPEVRSA